MDRPGNDIFIGKLAVQVPADVSFPAGPIGSLERNADGRKHLRKDVDDQIL